MGVIDKNTKAGSLSPFDFDTKTFQEVYPEAWFEENTEKIRVFEHALYFSNLNFGLSLLWIKS